jgi:C_GCAxxG_C_C family probable redox protein
MSSVEKTVDLFMKGLNCSQSMLTGFGAAYGLEADMAKRLGRALGGGIGRQAGACGALTGAALILGLSKGDGEEDQARNETCRCVQELFSRFQRLHGSTKCRDLLGEDVSTEEGVKKVVEEKLIRKVCPPFVRDAATILQDLL